MVVMPPFGPGRLGRYDQSMRRSGAVTRRNLAALRSVYWVVVVSGLVEPMLYLFSIGIGVGKLVGKLPLADGRLVPYAAFVAPSMLAASTMFGALTESTFNFFGKMKYMRLYDGVLATPVQPMEVAFGELLWAMARGAIYGGAFLVVMVLLGLTGPGWALAAFPATLLVKCQLARTPRSGVRARSASRPQKSVLPIDVEVGVLPTGTGSVSVTVVPVVVPVRSRSPMRVLLSFSLTAALPCSYALVA